MGILVVENDGGPAALRPRALERVGNRPIARHVLDALVETGMRSILVIGPGAYAEEISDALEESGRAECELQYLSVAGRTDLAGGIAVAGPLIGDAPGVVHLASGLLGASVDVVGSLRSGAPDVAVLVHRATRPPMRLSAASRDMLHLAELDPQRNALGTTGVWLFGPGALGAVGSLTWDRGGEVDLVAVAENLRAAGGNLNVQLASGWHCYDGDCAGLLELNRTVLDRLPGDPIHDAPAGIRIEGRVQIAPGATVRSSVIVGPAIIGEGAQILDAYIGPYTSIGPGARVEGTEIERSIVAAAASITHVGGRLTESVVGREARVFRDFSLPRAMRLRVGPSTEVALA